MSEQQDVGGCTVQSAIESVADHLQSIVDLAAGIKGPDAAAIGTEARGALAALGWPSAGESVVAVAPMARAGSRLGEEV